LDLYEVLSVGQFAGKERGEFKERLLHCGRRAIEYYVEDLKGVDPRHSGVVVLEDVFRGIWEAEMEDQLVGYVPARRFWELVGPDDVAVGPLFYDIAEDGRISLYISPNPIGWFTDGEPVLLVFRGGFGSYPEEEGVWVFAPDEFWRRNARWLDALATENELLRTVYASLLRYFSDPDDGLYRSAEEVLPHLRRLFGMRGDRLILWEWWQVARYISFMGYGERLPILLLDLALNTDFSPFTDITSFVRNIGSQDIARMSLYQLFTPLMIGDVRDFTLPEWLRRAVEEGLAFTYRGGYAVGLLEPSGMLAMPGADVFGAFLVSPKENVMRLFVAPKMFGGYNYVMHGPVVWEEISLPPYVKLR